MPPLRGLAQIRARADGGPLRDAWEDLAPLRHLRRPSATQQPMASRDFGDILTAFGQVKRAALLGRPGAGKTTTLNKLAADLARRAKSDAAAPLPLLVSLGDWTGKEPLPAFLADHLPEIGWALNALSHAKRMVLLLDGLNEIPTHQRQAKTQQVRALIGKLEKDTPVYVSCRADDYVGELDLDLDTLTLQPLSPPQIRAVLHHWLCLQFGDGGPERAERLFWQLAGDPALAGLLKKWRAGGANEELFWKAEDIPLGLNVYGKTTGQDDHLWRQHIRNPRSLIRLAANPFMLTMLFWVWLDRDETLPRNRGELFARFVDALLEREHLAAWDETTECCRYQREGEQLLAGLADLA
jgi:predicted NACHT family NTPase